MKKKIIHNFKPGKIKICQICNSRKLVPIVSLGNQPLANTLLNKKSEEKFVKKYPLNIIACKDCTLLQLDYIVDQNKVYHKKYPYLPGITKQVDLEQKEFADDVLKKISLKKNDLVIDIGSNDGNLLKHFKKKIKVLGVEPTNIAKIANKNKIKTIQSFFNPKTAKLIKNKLGKAKIITATNVFAHMSTLGDVMNSICLLLKEDGYFVFENHYIMPIINNVQYDTFYHEHIRTYSLLSLQKLFKIYNLNLYDAKIVKRYGGSIRCFVSRKKVKNSKNLNGLLKIEKNKLIKNFNKTYSTFKKNILISKKELINQISKIRIQNKTIAAKSCPARAVVLLNYCNIDSNQIKYIAEQPTSLKLNKYIPGTGIKVVDEKVLLKETPDYLLLLAWHISGSIIKKWSKKIKTKFIIPLPKLKIIK
jgi:2-polyprenyl-3-methyl-5-hydroxy-6-metoxy-1,4-benzoquinol methylase